MTTMRKEQREDVRIMREERKEDMRITREDMRIMREEQKEDMRIMREERSAERKQDMATMETRYNITTGISVLALFFTFLTKITSAEKGNKQ
jgi:hypothetical protein